MNRLSEEPRPVSGRSSHVVSVAPLDDLRYGYRVWIDDASAMPLKTAARLRRPSSSNCY
jgi:negative regulator of sigma E activity